MLYVVVIGVGKVMMECWNDLMYDYIFGFIGKECLCVFFVGMVIGDDVVYIVSFYFMYDFDCCVLYYLLLFYCVVDDLVGFVCGFDVIYVGGGNIVNMFDVWKCQGLDEIMCELWEDFDLNVVFIGGSVGGICWFEGGMIDSYGFMFQVLLEGFGFLYGSFCLYYDVEDQCWFFFYVFFLSGELFMGYVVGNFQLLYFENFEFVIVISLVDDFLVLWVEVVDGKIVEMELLIRWFIGLVFVVKGLLL